MLYLYFLHHQLVNLLPQSQNFFLLCIIPDSFIQNLLTNAVRSAIVFPVPLISPADVLHTAAAVPVAERRRDHQPLIQDNSAQYYTTVTQKTDTDHCAKLVGICCDYAQQEQARPILIRSGTDGLISRPFFLTNLLRAIDQSHSAPSAPECPARDVFCPLTAKKSAGD